MTQRSWSTHNFEDFHNVARSLFSVHTQLKDKRTPSPQAAFVPWYPLPHPDEGQLAIMSHAQKAAKGPAGGGGKAGSKAKKAGAAGSKKVEDDRDETLQAVVCPSCLTDLANRR